MAGVAFRAAMQSGDRIRALAASRHIRDRAQRQKLLREFGFLSDLAMACTLTPCPYDQPALLCQAKAMDFSGQSGAPDLQCALEHFVTQCIGAALKAWRKPFQ